MPWPGQNPTEQSVSKPELDQKIQDIFEQKKPAADNLFNLVTYLSNLLRKDIQSGHPLNRIKWAYILSQIEEFQDLTDQKISTEMWQRIEKTVALEACIVGITIVGLAIGTIRKGLQLFDNIRQPDTSDQYFAYCILFAILCIVIVAVFEVLKEIVEGLNHHAAKVRVKKLQVEINQLIASQKKQFKIK